MEGHIGPYGERRARVYNGGLGAVPPAGSRDRAPGQRIRGRSPLKLNTFYAVLCLKWRKAAMFMSKVVNLTGLLGDIKEDWGSRGRKSPSRVKGR